MSSETAFGIAILVAIGVAIFGVIRRFPWYIIGTLGITNSMVLVFCFWGFLVGAVNAISGSALWWLLTIPSLLLGFIAAFNLKSYFDGSAVRDDMEK